MAGSIKLTPEQAELLAERVGSKASGAMEPAPFDPEDVLSTYDALTPMVELIRELQSGETKQLDEVLSIAHEHRNEMIDEIGRGHHALGLLAQGDKRYAIDGDLELGRKQIQGEVDRFTQEAKVCQELCDAIEIQKLELEVEAGDQRAAEFLKARRSWLPDSVPA